MTLQLVTTAGISHYNATNHNDFNLVSSVLDFTSHHPIAGTPPTVAKCQTSEKKMANPPFTTFHHHSLASTFRDKFLQILICGRKNPATNSCTGSELQSKSDRISLSDLLQLQEWEEQLFSDGIQDVVRRVKSGERKAVEDVRKLTKDNMEIRDMFGEMGVIPLLVSMIDYSGEITDQINVLYALLNVGVGHDRNKATIANTGVIDTLLTLLSASPLISKLSEPIIANLLSLSALHANKPILVLSGIIPILVPLLSSSNTTSICKQDSIRTLLNLSQIPTTTHLTHLIPTFVDLIADPDINVYALSILSNLVSKVEGQVAASRHYDVLIDVLTWVDAPLCQEKAVYILMVIACRMNYIDKAKMVDAGIIPNLLELMLTGTNLAENCACRLLETLTVDKGMELTVLKRLVEQSLKENMRRIVKRANLKHVATY